MAWAVTAEYVDVTMKEDVPPHVAHRLNCSCWIRPGANGNRLLVVSIEEPHLPVTEVLSRLGKRLSVIGTYVQRPEAPTYLKIRPSDLSDQREELISLSQAALIFGVSRQRAQQLSKRSDFPPAVTRLPTGPVFSLTDIEMYQRTRHVRSSGSDVPYGAIFAPG